MLTENVIISPARLTGGLQLYLAIRALYISLISIKVQENKNVDSNQRKALSTC
jgi:hypothetical protein